MNRKTMIFASGMTAPKREIGTSLVKDAKNPAGVLRELAIDGATIRSGAPSPDAPATLASLGEGNGVPALTVRIHGENHLSGDAFYEALRTRATGTFGSNTNGPTYRLLSSDSSVFLDSSNRKFRKNTVYTFRVRFNDPTPTSTTLYPQFAIQYSDGTEQEMASHLGKVKDNLFCEVTAPGKTVVGVRHRYRSNKNFTFFPADFALLEGEKTVSDFFPYCGADVTVPLSEPLRGMQSGGAFWSDRLLFREKKVVRSVRNAFSDAGAAEVIGNGVFRIPLSVRGSLTAPNLLSDVFAEAASPDEVSAAPFRAALSEDREYLYFSLSEGAEEAELSAFLAGRIPTVLYVTGSPTVEDLSYDLPAIPEPESTYYEIYDAVAPRRMILIPDNE